jgi:hypothetical protein
VAAGGSGSSYIYGFVDANFRPGMSRDECLAFVRAALSHAMARDGSSGACVRGTRQGRRVGSRRAWSLCNELLPTVALAFTYTPPVPLPAAPCALVCRRRDPHGGH